MQSDEPREHRRNPGFLVSNKPHTAEQLTIWPKAQHAFLATFWPWRPYTLILQSPFPCITVPIIWARWTLDRIWTYRQSLLLVKITSHPRINRVLFNSNAPRWSLSLRHSGMHSCGYLGHPLLLVVNCVPASDIRFCFVSFLSLISYLWLDFGVKRPSEDFWHYSALFSVCNNEAALILCIAQQVIILIMQVSVEWQRSFCRKVLFYVPTDVIVVLTCRLFPAKSLAFDGFLLTTTVFS